MKTRRREVNIFNMSLLDILCGALGAFCFMMLTLFPSYIAARSPNEFYGKDIEKDWEDVEKEAGSFIVVARWESQHDVDLYIKYPDSTIYGSKARGPMKPTDAIIRDRTRGPAYEAFEQAGGPERAALAVYLRVASANGATGPAEVRVCVFRRIRLLERSQFWGWPQPAVMVPLDGTEVALGEFSVDPASGQMSIDRTGDKLF